MPSQVIGLIEIDDAAPVWQSLLTVASTRFDLTDANYARRVGSERVCPANFAQTESLEADARQLTAELEAEFCRLMSRLPAR
ncbi:MAG TPA: hypothetical protein VGI75_02760 [Pirellulales bacterium]